MEATHAHTYLSGEVHRGLGSQHARGQLEIAELSSTQEGVILALNQVGEETGEKRKETNENEGRENTQRATKWKKEGRWCVVSMTNKERD